MVSEQTDEDKLFELAAEHYARNREEGIDTLVVIPLWDEIDRFSLKAREALRRHGVLGEEMVERATLRPVTRTEEQKIHWSQYQLGDQLYFVRETRQTHRGQSAEVIGIERDGLRVRGETGREFKVTRRHQATFEVARKVMLPVATGDRILIRARGGDFKNGEVAEVARVNVAQNEVFLADGRRLPNELKTWTYAHALTSYRAQGMTVDESILVLGHQSAETLGQRQFYVGNTRYRERHHLYVASHATVVRRLRTLQNDRELATEFLERQNLTHTHSHFERMQERIRHWMHWQQRQNQGERQGMRV
jgi:RNase P/RNase MRP subunit p29